MTIENFNKIELIIILAINGFSMLLALIFLFYALIFQIKYIPDVRNKYLQKNAKEYIQLSVCIIIFTLLINLLCPCAFNYAVSYYSNLLK